MRNAGIRLRREKCKFFEEKIENLGHVVDQHGVRPNPEKAAAFPSSYNADRQTVAGILAMYGAVLLRLYSTLCHSFRAA